MFLPAAFTILSASLFGNFFNITQRANPDREQKNFSAPPPLRFELRHLHAVSSSARVVFADVSTTAQIDPNNSNTEDTYTTHARSVIAHRPLHAFQPYSRARRRSVRHDEWEEVEIPGPDVESRETLLQLAKMCNNAYVLPEDDAWYDLGEDWDHVGLFTIALSLK